MNEAQSAVRFSGVQAHKSYEYSERKMYHAKGVYYGKTYYVGPLPRGKILIRERREAGPGVHGLHSSPDFDMQSGILCPCMALFFRGYPRAKRKRCHLVPGHGVSRSEGPLFASLKTI